ncbi:MAG: 50S ribosomal protein L22 [Candidatus Roizmanbacteria bacterium GW2011_GWA2_37_7]|uniref:50S ribosomal protein L22 n=1 Tax=Candidatus Roizmanbacteria bacterium GW2011_GWA2_37_7 TaxID=1618481 RepID=A0A0G0HIB3_9BACT|nr:MAG: 50S ribosomal protein L22 [Candidatus Roizmanbacteria bacterium GW2011_GWA2_37_7]
MESLTYIKNIKITPKKLRMIRDLVVRMSPQDALDHLLYTTSKASKIYYKAIHSAVSNATQSFKVSPDMLQFKLLNIEEGRTLKRFHAGSKGMAKPIKKSFSHIKIILESVQEKSKTKHIEQQKKIAKLQK